ncbi:MAG: Rpn family recombination-promoting nuclease/putative transposase [Gammaproteobacteria bacterium]|nr:Rpn family recombination-promoting nuclease/putative transposase [Gammaproteobacteria bacterium]MDE0270411.1 Rpn family recombination-promoting nuclease/putative transposase [Gammaproteobacteria bacterium]
MNRQPHNRPQQSRGARTQPHDIAFKSLYGFRLVVLDLLKIVLPQGLVDRFHPDTLERLPAEWLSPNLERRHGDCVWRARLRRGGSLIVLIEFQRSLDRLMPVRVASYASMLLLDLAKRGELDRGPRGRILPLVRPVVLYNGLRPWRSPLSLSALTPEGAGDWLDMTLLDMGRMPVEDLPAGNAVTTQVEVLQGGLARDADGVLERMAKRLGGPEHRELRSAFIQWVWQSAAPDLGADAALLEPELLRIAELGEVREMKTLMMKSMVDHWLAEGRMEGRSEGLAEGEARGRSEERERLRRELSALKLDPETAARVSKLLDQGE